MSPSPPPLPGDRVFFIDSLRGFALLGVFMVNIQSMGWPMQDRFIVPDDLGAAGLAGRMLSMFFLDGAFWFLFAMLFGAGFAILMEPTAAGKPKLATAGYLRRLSLLGLFGGFHAVFLWWGDVLMVYAISGLLLLPFLNRSNRALLGWSTGCLGAGLMVMLFFLAIVALVSFIPELQEMDELSSSAAAMGFPDRAELINVYQNGGFREVLAMRFVELRILWPTGLLEMGVMSVVAMLFGMWWTRKGWFRTVATSGLVYRRILWFALVPAIVGKAMVVIGFSKPEGEDSMLSLMIATVGFIMAAPALGLLYLALYRLFFLKFGHGMLAHGLAAAGKMTLTNYLMQSLIAGFVFYGYGLGWFAVVSPPLLSLLAVTVFAGQVMFSRWWLGRFRLGPVETIVRRWTYWKG